MEVISEVLKVLRLDGALFFNAEFSAPWCISEPRSADIASHLSPAAGHLIIFPHGDPHFLGNGPPEKPVDAFDDSVAAVAAAVGYGSEASFNRAFRREFEHPPAQFRRRRRSVGL
jgi:AraC-like DNA-binding protein